MAQRQIQTSQLNLPQINVRDFGAAGDGVTDDTAAIQLALDDGANNHRAVYFPAGTYVVTDTLWAAPEGSQYKTVVIVGDGSGWWSGGRRTLIDGSAITSKPIINFPEVRGSIMRGIKIEGGNGLFTGYGTDELDYSLDWTAVGFRDSRYSPQCGISIDAGVGTDPPDGGYDNFVYSTRTGGSARIMFDDVYVDQCVVSWMISPDGTTQQANNITFLNCMSNNSKVGIACGQSQARALVFMGGSIGNCLVAYDGKSYGQQQGPGIVFIGTEFGPCFELLNTTSEFGLVTFNGIRTEGIHRIGLCNGATGAYPLTFLGCDFSFLNFEGYGTTTQFVLQATGTPVSFKGCSFKYDGSTGTKPAGYWMRAGVLSFEECQFSVNDRYDLFIGDQYYGQYSPSLKNCRAYDASSYVYISSDSLEINANNVPRISEHATGRTTLKRYATAEYMYVRNATFNEGIIGNAESSAGTYAFSATELTFTSAATANRYLLIGDTLLWQMLAVGSSTGTHIGPTLRVTNISGSTITCALLSPRKYYDETYNPTNVLMMQRCWAPAKLLTGDTNTSTSLTNVSPTDILKDRDWILGSADIPYATRVVSGGGTSTVTLSKAATGTGVGRTLYFDRLHTITSTAAF